MLSKPLSRKTLLTVGGFGVILAAFALGGYLPYHLERGVIERDIQRYQTELAESAVQSQRLKEMTRQAHLIEPEVAKYDRLVPDTMDIGLFHEQLSEKLTAVGLQDTSVRALAPTTLGKCQRLPIEIRGTGTYAQYQAFLKRLEALPRKCSVSRVQIEADAAMSGRVAAELTLSIYSTKPK